MMEKEKVVYSPLTKEALHSIKVGDVAERMLAFTMPDYHKVTDVSNDLITIGMGWTFDRNTGIEIDKDIPVSVSYIRRVLTEDQINLLKTLKFGQEIPF